MLIHDSVKWEFSIGIGTDALSSRAGNSQRASYLTKQKQSVLGGHLAGAGEVKQAEVFSLTFSTL